MADLSIASHGSIFILTPVSEAGQAWIDEHIGDDAMMWGANGIVVEHRFINDIAHGAINDGLEVM